MFTFRTTSLAMATAMATLATPSVVQAETALPAATFTDSIGVNIHLEYTDTYYFTRQDTVETLLRDARIRHVRTRFPAINPNEVPAAGVNSNLTNAAALLSRAGVRTVITGAALINLLYLDTIDRYERTANSSWKINFDDVWTNADNAQAWWNLHAPGTTRIGGVEGANEPNLKWNNSVCANWRSKVADYQNLMNQAVAAKPNLTNVLHIGPSPVHSSGSLCGDGPAKDPFRSLGQFAAPVGVGFNVAWNDGWVAPPVNQSSPAWFTATPGSVAATVDIANIHAYPPIDNTPEYIWTANFWTTSIGNKCNNPVAPGDIASGGALFSCAVHAARLQTNNTAKPIYVTEAGYEVTSTQVTEHTRGIYLPRLLLNNFKNGVARTYIYELMQQFPNSTAQRRFWLAGPNGATTTSYGYNALRRLQQAIGDGSLPTGQPSGQLDLTVTELGQPGVPADPAFPVQHQLFLEKDGSYSLALWPVDKVAVGNNEQTPPERRVRIVIGGAAKRFTLHPINPESTVDVVAGQLLTASAVQTEVVLTGGHAVVVKLRNP